ncbi:MAG: ATP-binding cassette domain-containing protein, partial [Planctomycetes bacterium]|nr:ATP-binding cassette domain-containing protein [Planctomycetota bacterium]
MNESMATEPILLARGLTRKFGTGWGGKHELALAGFDLAVAPGESVVLAGPNGAGKSTCLRILAGVDQPSAGTVSVLGQAPGHRRVRRRIAFVPDGSLLFPFLDARETLDFFAALHGLR